MTEMSNCIPDLCSLPALVDNEFCPVIKDLPIKLNQLYTGSYAVMNEVPTITNGLTELYKNTLGAWMIKYALAIMVPYVIIFIVLLCILMTRGFLSYYVGIILIILVLVVSLIGILFIINDAYNSGNTLRVETQKILKTNWQSNKDTISYNVGTAYISPDSVICPVTHSSDDNLYTKNENSSTENNPLIDNSYPYYRSKSS